MSAPLSHRDPADWNAARLEAALADFAAWIAPMRAEPAAEIFALLAPEHQAPAALAMRRSVHLRDPHVPDADVDAIAALLNQSDRAVEKRVRADLARLAPYFARALDRALFLFVDLADVPDDERVRALQRIDDATLAQALRNEVPGIADRLLSGLPAERVRAVQTLRDAAPFNLHETEAAKQAVVRIYLGPAPDAPDASAS